MRLAEAHGALARFLLAHHARGARWVLVITGKGGRAAGRSDWTDRSERGALRREVPVWLAEPQLRAIIVTFRHAAIAHGGDGALYIQLRRKT